MTGQGGWPMTVRPRPRRQPVLRRHLLPDQPRHGQPAFRQVLEAVADAWANRARRGTPGGRPTCASTCSSRPARPGGRARSTEACADAVAALRPGVRRRRTAASAARRSSRRRWCWSSCSGTPPGPAPTRWRWSTRTLRGDGPRRHLRPARRRLRALHRRRALGGAALREDALRQRPAARALRPVAATARWASGSPRETADFLLARAAHRRGRLRVRAGRRHRGRRGQVLRLDARPQLVEVLGRGRRRLGGRGASRSPTRAPSSTAPRRCSCSATPTTRTRLAPTSAPAARRPATERVRPARDDKVVAAWNGLAIAALVRRRAAARTSRSTSTPRSRPAELLVDGCTCVDGRLLRVSRDGVAGPARGCARGLRLRGRGFLALAAGDRRRALAGPRASCCSTRR